MMKFLKNTNNDEEILKEKTMKKKGFTLIELLVIIAIIAMLLGIVLPVLETVKDKFNDMVITNDEIVEMETIDVIAGCALWGIGELKKVKIEPPSHPSKNISFSVSVKNLPVGAELKHVGGTYYIVWQPKEQASQEVIIVSKITKGHGSRLTKSIKLEAY